ncbi:RBBP9/YdeN family alpha/beta hydrolase [Inhella proteolytica]|uniref:Alpha/beta hydrolase n=1 Tax=Inhella proteolytica TaxID=2795029 RepID=A0A931J620_9BURK|nr:alpha/beta hydrolase [Inhella proteolytica]MBH9579428.1 alpha/beta hydrolase [Inhella proteolytica]
MAVLPHPGVADSPSPNAPSVLLLPGWLNSGEGHWQTLWESYFGDLRVQQHDWETPRRGDWMAHLDEVLLDQPRPVLLAAHSLGCHLVAAWAAHSRHTAQVAGALLVAPPDPAQSDWPAALRPSWNEPVLQPLPFPALLLHSSDDPFDRAGRAPALAQAWGARCISLGACGHVNADSGLGLWPQGRSYLRSLLEPD